MQEVVELANPVRAALTPVGVIENCKFTVNTNLPRNRSINISGYPVSLEVEVLGDREYNRSSAVSPGVVRDELIRYTIMTNESLNAGVIHVFGSESNFEGNYLGAKLYNDETIYLQVDGNTTEGFNRYFSSEQGAFIKLKYFHGVWQITDQIGTWSREVV